MSEGWREGSDQIPEDFKHRPVHLIKHMRSATEASLAISDGMITQMSPKTFQVQSIGKEGRMYKVEIANELSLPTCECREFQKSHLPCKHFAALLRMQLVSWTQFPENYTENPLFTIDVDCVEWNDATVTDGKAVEEGQCLTEASDIRRMTMNDPAVECREILTQIMNASYLVESPATLHEVNNKLRSIYQDILNSCPSSGGLLTRKKKHRGTKRSYRRKKINQFGKYNC